MIKKKKKIRLNNSGYKKKVRKKRKENPHDYFTCNYTEDTRAISLVHKKFAAEKSFEKDDPIATILDFLYKGW